ncbi:HAD-IA family hydrolase [Erythrobacter litoralis]|uniref:Hydrolase, haloacid dehalogenase-like family protein n=1 Tax=Erythrobacter litoralis (strain HTCC2594) TaxID=314225 RepID=Q2ND81_ERYLH|nr:HAD-IA family hydrolase [Erythrobacter litoralis]ABC62360.1 hydrolase, haloacid dehalogenase-like family protein [Erythrobacter litoralis HTCC2594]
MTARLAVFDCDGTLVDGQGAVCDAMEAAFAAASLPAPDRRDVRQIVGLSLPQAIRMLAREASDDQVAQAVDAYKASFFEARQQGRVHEPLFDGIVPLLDRLGTGGWALAVATGKSNRGLHTVLTQHGLIERFASLQGADHHPSKPHPAMLHVAMEEAFAEPAATVMIGDTTYDIEMGRAAGTRAIGVAWGYHPREALLDAGAEAVAETPEQLGDMLDG